MRIAEIIILILVIISFFIALFFYPQMPDNIASHWNYQGQADGYMPRIWGLFLMPIILLVLFLLFVAIPRIDPKKENIEKFRNYFDAFIVIFFLIMMIIFIQMILWNLGTMIPFTLTLPTCFGILFFYVGILCEKAKKNWFIGIRTPWTMSNQQVWDSTHKLAGKLFKASGIIAIIGIAFQDHAFFFAIVPVIASAIALIVYSFIRFREIVRKR